MMGISSQYQNKRWIIKIGKSLLRMVVLLGLVSLGAFLLVSASPMDPLQTNIGQVALGSMSQEQIERLNEYWG